MSVIQRNGYRRVFYRAKDFRAEVESGNGAVGGAFDADGRICRYSAAACFPLGHKGRMNAKGAGEFNARNRLKVC